MAAILFMCKPMTWRLQPVEDAKHLAASNVCIGWTDIYAELGMFSCGCTAGTLSLQFCCSDGLLVTPERS